MSSTSTMGISQQNLVHLYDMLKCATEPNPQKQKMVYEWLAESQQYPPFYVGLAIIASTPDSQITVRQIALLTLKSALQRRKNDIEFSMEQSQYIRNCIFNGDYSISLNLMKAQKSLISLLTLWDSRIDFNILNGLATKINSNDQKQRNWALQILFMIFEDVKFETQNFSCFQQPQFLLFLQNFVKSFMHHMTLSNIETIERTLLCMNLLLKYLEKTSNGPNLINYYLGEYLIKILNPANKMPQKILSAAVDGFTQITSIQPKFILQCVPALTTISEFQHQNSEVTKKWQNLVLDILERDDNEQLKQYLDKLIPKIINNLLFTQQDQLSMKMEEQEQANPYEYEENEQLDEVEEGQIKGGDYSYTKRRLSVIILAKLVDLYINEVLQICGECIKKLLVESNHGFKEVGILMIGIIFTRAQQDYHNILEVGLPIIEYQIGDGNAPSILRCTSLWSIGQIMPLIERDAQYKKKIQQIVIGCLFGSASQVRDAAYSTLYQLVRVSLPVYLQQVVECMVQGIQSCKGRHLNSVLRTVLTLYEEHSETIPPQPTLKIMRGLCQKWAGNSKIQSIMFPVLQCLTTIASSHNDTFKVYALQIFNQTVLLLSSTDHKPMIIRAIDLLGSLCAMRVPDINTILHNDNMLHNKVRSLLNHQQVQVVNFTLSIVGDICRATILPHQQALLYIQLIRQIMETRKSKFNNNGLICLTELILTHPQVGHQYCSDSMQKACSYLRTNNPDKITAANYSKCFGRLSNLNPNAGSILIKQNLQSICLGLFVHEYQSSTDQAFKGLFKAILVHPPIAFDQLEYLVISYKNYQKRPNQSNNQNWQTFLYIIKYFRSQISPLQWQQFKAKPIFLPAVAHQLEILTA